MAPGGICAHNFATSRRGSFCAQFSGVRLPLVGKDLVLQVPSSAQPVTPTPCSFLPTLSTVGI